MSTATTLPFAGRHPVLASVLRHLLGFAVLAGLIALNRWIFAEWLGADYLGWYRANADKLSFTLAVAAIVWGEQMDRHTGLIGTNPLDQLGSYLQLMGVTLLTLGTGWRSRSGRVSVFDVLLGAPVMAAFVVAVLAWLVFVAPLQYFVQLVCGAPARVALYSDRRTIIRWDQVKMETKEVARMEETPEGWWGSVFAEKPVKVTTAFATMLMVALKALHVL
ncbi:MAG TPA: hypothetical protein VF092_31350 [Longimicrobium sp.]